MVARLIFHGLAFIIAILAILCYMNVVILPERGYYVCFGYIIGYALGHSIAQLHYVFHLIRIRDGIE